MGSPLRLKQTSVPDTAGGGKGSIFDDQGGELTHYALSVFQGKDTFNILRPQFNLQNEAGSVEDGM